jgi:hypothetical protein
MKNNNDITPDSGTFGYAGKMRDKVHTSEAGGIKLPTIEKNINFNKVKDMVASSRRTSNKSIF